MIFEPICMLYRRIDYLQMTSSSYTYIAYDLLMRVIVLPDTLLNQKCISPKENVCFP